VVTIYDGDVFGINEAGTTVAGFPLWAEEVMPTFCLPTIGS
jgi:hypothetical protein